MIAKYARGMVYWINLPNTFGDSVQTGRRPCVIISNNVGNIFSENVTVVPCTTNIEKADSQPTHYTTKLYATTESVVLCENIITVSKRLCDTFIGLLDEHEMKNIDKCVSIALGLQEVPKSTNIAEVQEDTLKLKSNRIASIDIKKEYLADFEKYGVDYVIAKYNVASISAAHQRRLYYQKQLTKKK